MTNSKLTRRALFTSIMALVLCFAMLTGTTFAWFTDQETSGNNQIIAGNLDIEMYNVLANEITETTDPIDDQTKLFDDIKFWEPGAVAYENITVKNVGNLALKYQLSVNFADAGLAKALKVAVVDNGVTTNDRATLLGSIADTEWKPIVSFSSEITELKNTNDTKTYGIVIYWQPSDNDNAYNANDGSTTKYELGLGVTLVATQLAAEEDAFGPDYDKDALNSVYDAQGLQNAINAGETYITLNNDISLDESIVIPASATTTYSLRAAAPAITIDLNGNTISGTMHKNSGAVIKNDGNLILKNGTVSSTANNGGSAIVNNGTAVLENVTLNGAPNADGSWPAYTLNNTGSLEATDVKFTSYHGSVCSYGEGAIVTLYNCKIDMAGIPGFTSHGIYTYSSGAVVVSGGVYANKATDQSATDGSVINGNVTVNGGTFTGRIVNYYGTPVIKAGTFSTDPSKYLDENCSSAKNDDGTYTVTMKQTAVGDMISGAEAGETVVIPEGTYTFPASGVKEGVVVECAPGTVFEGTSSLNVNGATVVGGTFTNDSGFAVSGTINGTFKNCTFESSEVLRWCYSNEGEEVVFENCIFKTNFRGIHFDTMNGNVKFINCEINGFNAYGGDGTMTFEGCTFGYDKSSYNGLNIYSNTVITDCTFNYVSGKTNFIDMEGTGKTLSITNCTATLDGEATNVVDFVGGSMLAQNTLIIDGATYANSAEALKSANGGNIVLTGTVDLGGTSGNYLTINEDTTVSGGTIKGTGWTGEMNYAVNATSGNIIFDGVTFDTTDWTTDGWAGWGISANVNGTANVTFKNCIFKGSQCPIYQSGADSVITLDNCKFETTIGAIQCEIYSGDFQLGQDLIIKNCDFTGVTDVLHIYDYDKDPASEAIAQYLTDNGNTFTGTCKQTCK